jgi:hypothetical protein
MKTSKAARESELASARIEHEWRSRSVRAREHALAGLAARLTSLEELDAARAGYGDAARTVLVQANGKVNQRGSIADYLEVEAGSFVAVLGPNGVAYDRGRSLEVTALTVSGTDQALGEGFIRLSRVDWADRNLPNARAKSKGSRTGTLDGYGGDTQPTTRKRRAGIDHQIAHGPTPIVEEQLAYAPELAVCRCDSEPLQIADTAQHGKSSLVTLETYRDWGVVRRAGRV